jgi:rod shape-determining protein MreD
MQPTHSSRRILLPVKGWFITFSFVLALLLNLIPFGRLPFLPDWIALTLTFWCVREPLRVGMGAAFLLGVVMDVADGSVMGQHALAYVLLAFTAAALARRILWFPLQQQAIHVFPMFLATQLLMTVVRMVGGADFPGLLYFISSLASALLWYPLTYLLLIPQFRPVDRDENRPI